MFVLLCFIFVRCIFNFPFSSEADVVSDMPGFFSIHSLIHGPRSTFHVPFSKFHLYHLDL